jgi:sugar lactone lactonase YvrE
MTSLNLGRYALLSCVAAAMLTGCGGSQPPIGAPGAMSQSPALQSLSAQRDRRGSWMVPGTIVGHSADYVVSGSLLYVANYLAYTVTVYHPNANDPSPIATISDGLNGPAGTCLDSQGTLYVTNEPSDGAGWVSEYPLGKTKRSKVITSGIDSPAFCAVDAKGNLWLTNIGAPNATEYLYGSKTPHTVITKDMVYPTGIAIDSSGNLYVSNRLRSGGDVVVFPPGSKAPSRVITDGATSPVALAIDASGDLYVTNITENKVAEYPPGGNHPFRTITQGLSTPFGVTVNEKGWLFVANFEPSTVVQFRPGSTRPSKRTISKDVDAPNGLAIYPPVLP